MFLPMENQNKERARSALRIRLTTLFLPPWMKKALFINLLGAVVARLYDRNRIATLVEQLAYCLRFVGKIRVVAT